MNEVEMKNEIRKLAKDAILVQDACNLSGVVHGFSRAMTALREALPEAGTDEINRHPISVLYSSKIASLTGSESMGDFSKAYEWARVLEPPGA